MLLGAMSIPVALTIPALSIKMMGLIAVGHAMGSDCCDGTPSVCLGLGIYRVYNTEGKSKVAQVKGLGFRRGLTVKMAGCVGG